jgi:uncharacterized protein involved in exopolysaccharide biosynthesis
VPENRSDPFALEPVAPLDLGRLLWVVWYGKWLIAVCVAAAVWLGGYYVFHLNQPRYAATATLRIDPQPTNLRDVSDHWPAPPTDLASLNTEIAILLSDRIIAQVVSQQGLLDDPEFNRYLVPPGALSPATLRDILRARISGVAKPPPDAAAVFDKTVDNLRAALSASHPRDTYLFHLTAVSRDPEKAAQLANAVAASYVASQIAEQDEATRADITWLGTRVAELRRLLQEQETGITRLHAAALVQDASGLDRLAEAVRSAEQDQATLVAALTEIDNATPQTARERATRAQIATALDQQTAQTARLSAQLAAQSTGLADLQQAEREAEATRVLYEAFLVRLQEAQVQRGLDAATARILAPATAGSYAGPQKILIIEVAALLGLFAGLALVALQHMRRRGVLFAEMVETVTGAPVVASLERGTIAGRPVAGAKLRRGLMIANRRQVPQVIMVTGPEGQRGTGRMIALLTQGSPKARSLIVTTDVGSLPRGLAAQATIATISENDLQDWASLKAQFQIWRDAYDLIVIDGGAAAPASPALLLAELADICLFSVRWAATPTAKVGAAHARLRAAAPTAIATVLTGIHPRKLRQFARCYAPVSAPT